MRCMMYVWSFRKEKTTNLCMVRKEITDSSHYKHEKKKQKSCNIMKKLSGKPIISNNMFMTMKGKGLFSVHSQLQFIPHYKAICYQVSRIIVHCSVRSFRHSEPQDCNSPLNIPVTVKIENTLQLCISAVLSPCTFFMWALWVVRQHSTSLFGHFQL